MSSESRGLAEMPVLHKYGRANNLLCAFERCFERRGQLYRWMLLEQNEHVTDIRVVSNTIYSLLQEDACFGTE